MARRIQLHNQDSLWGKIKHFDWLLLGFIFCVACVGFASLYSAAGGSFSPWASKQIVRFCVGLVCLFVVALTDIRIWYRLSWLFFIGGFILLFIVEIMGQIGMGAQRWINLGFMQLQPSELMKIALVMVLARYFHRVSLERMRDLTALILPALLIIMPVGMVLLQPDLGTALMLLMVGVGMFFIAGAPLWIFISGIILAAASMPVGWHFMHAYQKQRVMTFLNPESDPLGAGYHIIQSKIALGSGGMEGKGFLQGTQSHLNFLPEKQTDFIFTLWAEEWGFTGGIFVLLLFAFIFIYGLWIALQAKEAYCRYLALGLTINLSLYVFINIAMVMGLIPVVGAPLPLVSYGGTVMLSTMIGFGLMISCNIHRETKLSNALY